MRPVLCHVLTALAAGVEAGDDDVARAALADIDFVLRGLARRRLERAILDAAIAIGPVTEDTRGTRHRLRAAALIACGERCELRDPDAVTAAYCALDTRPPPRLPIATGLAAMAGVVMVMFVAFTMVRVVTAGAATGALVRPLPPPAVGAYRDGGTPRADAAIEQVLVTELPALAAVRVTDDAERTRRVAALRTHRAFAAHGAALAGAWRDMIDSYDRWRVVGGSVHAAHRDASRFSRELAVRVAVVSDRLAAGGLGYFLDVEIGDDARRRPGIYAFRVEEVAFVRGDDERIRVLGLRRLHRADGGEVVLGMTTSDHHDPMVLLDEVDDKVRTQIIPVLGGQPYILGDDGWARSAVGRRAAAAASEAIRRELHTALGFDVGSLERATARCKKLVAASVRRHEAQHGFDRGTDLAYPAALAAHAGPATSAFALRVRYELSGYLSQIASDQWLPQLTLWNLSRHAFRRAHRPIEEAHVAVFVIEGLARHLDIRSPGPVLHRGTIDRDRLAALVVPLAARSTTELRSAAAALWTEAFERRLVRIVDDT